jgi:hypothetical protein
VGRAFGVLDVGLLLVGNSTVLELLVLNLVLTIKGLAGTSPVPVDTADVLETGHLFVSKVGHNLEHVATISVRAKHFVGKKLDGVGALHVEGGEDKATNDPLGL